MNNVLLIYEYVPEHTSVFFIKAGNGMFERLKRCHNVLTNQINITPEQEQDMNWLSKLTESLRPLFSTKINEGAEVFSRMSGTEDEDGTQDYVPAVIRDSIPRKDPVINVSDIEELHIVYSGFIL